MYLVATYVHNRTITYTMLDEGKMINIDREWFLAGREMTYDDRFVSRGLHAQLYLLGDALFLINLHRNPVIILPGLFAVQRGETKRVDGYILRVGRTAVGDVHLDLDVDDARCPPTPLL